MSPSGLLQEKSSLYGTVFQTIFANPSNYLLPLPTYHPPISTHRLELFIGLPKTPIYYCFSIRQAIARNRQRFALATLFYATEGEWSWVEKDHWLSYDHHECDWFASEEFRLGGPPLLQESPCDDDDGIFRRLWLTNNNMNGSFPTREIYGLLTNLESINLFGNRLLNGPAMSSEIGLVSNLNALSFVLCGVSGTVPSEIGLLSSSMEIVYFSKLQKPEDLSTTEGYLTGSIPTQVGLMTNLRQLTFNNNFLTGVIPTELGLLTNLEFIAVPGNTMSGAIPSELGQMRYVQQGSKSNAFHPLLTCLNSFCSAA